MPATSVVAARSRRVCLLRSFSTAFVQAGELLANGLAAAGVCLSAIGLLLSGVLSADSRPEICSAALRSWRAVCLLPSFSIAFVQAEELLANDLAGAGVTLGAIGVLLIGVLTADGRPDVRSAAFRSLRAVCLLPSVSSARVHPLGPAARAA